MKSSGMSAMCVWFYCVFVCFVCMRNLGDDAGRDDVLRLARGLGMSLLGESRQKLERELKKIGCTETQPLDFPGFLRFMSWLTTVDVLGKKNAD